MCFLLASVSSTKQNFLCHLGNSITSSPHLNLFSAICRNEERQILNGRCPFLLTGRNIFSSFFFFSPRRKQKNILLMASESLKHFSLRFFFPPMKWKRLKLKVSRQLLSGTWDGACTDIVFYETFDYVNKLSVLPNFTFPKALIRSWFHVRCWRWRGPLSCEFCPICTSCYNSQR